jgi:hypothetical protein
MAFKIVVLAMLIALHSVAVLFASLATYRWLVDDATKRDVGVFGVCEYLDRTTISNLVHEEAMSQIAPASAVFSVKSKNNFTQVSSDAITDDDLKHEAISASIQFRSALPSIVQDNHEKERVEQTFRSMNDLVLLGENDEGIVYQKCYQLVWPSRSEAFKYLASKHFLLKNDFYRLFI